MNLGGIQQCCTKFGRSFILPIRLYVEHLIFILEDRIIDGHQFEITIRTTTTKRKERKSTILNIDGMQEGQLSHLNILMFVKFWIFETQLTNY